jgi:hypothetical protein
MKSRCVLMNITDSARVGARENGETHAPSGPGLSVRAAADGDRRVSCAHRGRTGSQRYRETLDRETLDDGALATGEYAWHGRSGVVTKVRVGTS